MLRVTNHHLGTRYSSALAPTSIDRRITEALRKLLPCVVLDDGTQYPASLVAAVEPQGLLQRTVYGPYSCAECARYFPLNALNPIALRRISNEWIPKPGPTDLSPCEAAVQLLSGDITRVKKLLKTYSESDDPNPSDALRRKLTALGQHLFEEIQKHAACKVDHLALEELNNCIPYILCRSNTARHPDEPPFFYGKRLFEQQAQRDPKQALRYSKLEAMLVKYWFNLGKKLLSLQNWPWRNPIVPPSHLQKVVTELRKPLTPEQIAAWDALLSSPGEIYPTFEEG